MNLDNKKTVERNFGVSSDANISKKNVNDEKWLRIIANIVLIAGIITAIYFFSFSSFNVQENMYSANGEVIGTYSKNEFNLNAFLISLSILFSSFLVWSFLRVISNISNSLKELKEK